MDRLDPDDDPEDQPSPAQSGQDGDEAQSAEAESHADLDWGDEGGDGPAASGSDQVVLRPGSSHAMDGVSGAAGGNRNAPEDQVDDGDPRPGPSSSMVSGSGRDRNVPDEGSNSADFWAASSSGGAPSGSANSREASQQNSPGSEAAAAGEDLPAGSDAVLIPPNQPDVGPGAASSSSQPSQSLRVVVSVAHFSPQPSSSSTGSSQSTAPAGGCSSASGGPSQSSNVSLGARNGAISSNSLAVSSTGASSSSASFSGFGLSSSSVASPNSQQGSRVTSGAPSASSVVVSAAGESPMFASSSSTSAPSSQQPSSPGPSGSQGGLHGEISNPPSPLGGSRPSPAGNARRGTKRDFPDSPIPGPSGSGSGGVNSSMVHAKRACQPTQDPEPGSSGVGQGGLASEAAAAVQHNQDLQDDDGVSGAAEGAEEETSSASSSTGEDGGEVAAAPGLAPALSMQQPLTPADNFMISSSTGIGFDSVPPTPVDIHGDNDLSVPSPGGAGLRTHMHSRRMAESEDVVDSTVDSTGLGMSGAMHGMEYENSEFCQSSRYLDSSDDDDDDDAELRTAMAVSRASHNIAAQRQQQAFISSSDREEPPRGSFNIQQQSSSSNLSINDDSSGISTSGQVDEGQFRLVPNAPEDESFNKRNPPRGVTNPGGAGPSPYDNPQPGPSRAWGSSHHRDATLPTGNQANFQHGKGYNLPPHPASRENESAGIHDGRSEARNDVLRQDNVGNGAELVQPQGSDPSASTGNNLDGLLPCPAEDLQLEPQLPSSFMDSSNFGPPVELEDIQVQKLFPEQQSKSQEQAGGAHHPSHPVPVNGDAYLNRDVGAASSSGASNSQHSSILESMTGPLSKRLRTLHNLQQQRSASPNNATAASPQASSSSGQGDHRSLNEQPERVVPKKPANKNPEASSSGGGNHQQSDSSDSNHSNGGGSGDSNGRHNHYPGNGNGGGPTTQTYSVTIEQQGLPNSLIMKPKRLFERKMWGDASDDGVSDKMAPPDLTADVADRDTKVVVEDVKRPRRAAARFGDGYCPVSAAMTITDAPVLSRAKATLPTDYLAIKDLPGKGSSGRGVGVFAKKVIPKGCKFGPMEGVVRQVDKPAGFVADDSELVLVVIADETTSVLDTSDDDTSNWMKFVRLSGSTQDQNLVLMQEMGQIFFVASRNILPRQELRVNYSPEYAAARNIDLPAEAEPQDDDGLWPCFECDRRLPSSQELQAHLDEHEEAAGSPAPLSGGGGGGRRSRRGQRSGPSSGQPIRRKIKVLLPERSAPDEQPDRKFKCHICSKQFSKENSLARHVMLHNGDKSHCCDACEAKFSHPENLAKHKKRAHDGEDENGGIKCSQCNLWFKLAAVHRVHLFSHHPEKSRQNLTAEDALARAKESHQAAQSAAPSPGLEMKFQCPECLSQFDAWLDLVTHVVQHGVRRDRAGHGARHVHKCELCYKSFSSEDRLKRHMANHGSDEEKPLACNDCGRRFSTNSALAGHLKVHATEKMAYDCPICGQVFDQIVHLKEHVHVHRVNGQYECPYCLKNFVEYSMVRKHIRAFHGKKTHLCLVCHKSFSTSDKLKIHSITHSDVKEFLCNTCGKQFKRKDKLKEHVHRMHSSQAKGAKTREASAAERVADGEGIDDAAEGGGQASGASGKGGRKQGGGRFVPKVSPTDYHRFIYKCHECLLGFKRRGMLVNHIAKRHPGMSPTAVPELNLPILKATKDYYCQYCSKVYKSSSKRKAHILKNHPGQKLPLSARSKAVSEEGSATKAEAGGAGAEAATVSAAPGQAASALTFSATVGSVTTQPHACPYCHKQYASNAKLLQHQRKKHKEMMPPEKQVPRGSGVTGRPAAAANSPQDLEYLKGEDVGIAGGGGMVQPLSPSPPLDGVALIASAAAAAATPPHHQQHHIVTFDPILHGEQHSVVLQQQHQQSLPAMEGEGEDVVPLDRFPPHQRVVKIASKGTAILQMAPGQQSHLVEAVHLPLVRPDEVLLLQHQDLAETHRCNIVGASRDRDNE